MNSQIKNAERLHRLLSDTDGLTDAELRRMLQAEGVDVSAYLERLKAVAPAPAVPPLAPRAMPGVSAIEPSRYCDEFLLAARQPQRKPDSRPPT